MQFNQYTAYSLVSTTENKNNSEKQKVFSCIDTLSKIKTITEAKEFLKQNYQIKNPVKNFSLGANSFLEVVENPNKFTLRISYTENDEKECVIFSYKK